MWLIVLYVVPVGVPFVVVAVVVAIAIYGATSCESPIGVVSVISVFIAVIVTAFKDWMMMFVLVCSIIYRYGLYRRLSCCGKEKKQFSYASILDSCSDVTS